jgi:hypothetical protein
MISEPGSQDDNQSWIAALTAILHRLSGALPGPACFRVLKVISLRPLCASMGECSIETGVPLWKAR